MQSLYENGGLIGATLNFGSTAQYIRSDDEYFSNVSLLLRADGVNNSTTFIDSSLNNFSITASGNAKISTAQSKFGGSSALFDGSGDFLTLNSTSGSPIFTFGSGDYTLECWVYHTALSSIQNYFRTQGSGINAAIGFRYDQTNVIQFFVLSATGVELMSISSASNPISINTWNHVAVVRNGSSHKIYINGVQSGSEVIASYTAPAPQSDIWVGKGPGISEYMNGYIDELRITKGVARYLTNFTVPTAAYPSLISGNYKNSGIWNINSVYDNTPRFGYRAITSAITTTITIPATTQEGDIIILSDRIISSNITATLPSGFTQIANTTNSTDRRTLISYKIASASDAGTTITGMTGTSSASKIITVFSTNKLAPTITVGSVVSTAYSDFDPAAQTVTLTGVFTPVMAIAFMGSSATFSTSSTPTGVELIPFTNHRVLYNFYNSVTVQNTTYDMTDGGAANQITVFYLKLG